MYRLLAFTEENLAYSLANNYTTPSEVRKKNHFKYFLEYLTAIEAKTIIIEEEYISKDYLHDYTSYYALCYVKYPKFCSRVHFFSLEFDKEMFETFISGTLPPLDIRNSYLGFIVVRPIPDTVVGFTVLKTYTHSTQFNHRNFWGIRKYPVNLFGIELEVKSLAFQEQDAVVAACATAAIWSMLHGAVDKSNHSIVLKSPSEITKDAGNSTDGNRLFPNKGGLDIAQICESIFQAGLVSEVKTHEEKYEIHNLGKEDIEEVDAQEAPKEKTEDENKPLQGCCLYEEDDRVPINFLKKVLNAHSSIGIPIILVLSISENDTHGFHAITVSGFVKGEPKPIVPQNEMSFLSDNIVKIYAHDDQWGPFVRITFLDDDYLQTNWTEIGNQVSIKSIIVPVYPKIRISYEEIDVLVRAYDAVLTLFLNPYISNDLVWDIKLLMNQDYKKLIQDLNPTSEYPRKLELLIGNFPKYIWTASCYISNHKILDFAFDATGVNQAMLGLHIINNLDDKVKNHLLGNLKANKSDELLEVFHHSAREQYYDFLINEISK